MPDYVSTMKADTVEQFKDKKNIVSLIEVLSEQLQEVYAFFEELRIGRWLDNASGVQLDRIGEIVVLSREEARNMYPERNDDTSDDEVYRQYLKYKIIENSFTCTYYDVKKSIEMFWDGPAISVSERIDQPARIILGFDLSRDWSNKILTLPIAKSSGVSICIFERINEKKELHSGLAAGFLTTVTVRCRVPSSMAVNYYTDEDDQILMDENGNRFFDDEED